MKFNGSVDYAVVLWLQILLFLTRHQQTVDMIKKTEEEIIMVDDADITSELEQLWTETTLSGRERSKILERSIVIIAAR